MNLRHLDSHAAAGQADGGGQRAERALQRPHGDRAQAIALVDHLTLLGDAQHRIARGGRGGTHQRIDAAAAQRDAAAPRVHDHRMGHAPQRRGERRLGPVDGVPRVADAPFLADVGMSEHHALASAARREMSLVGRIGEQQAHQIGTAFQGVEAFKHRGHIHGRLPGTLVPGLGPAGQQQHRQHIIDTQHPADDVIPDGVRSVAMPALHQRFEDAAAAASLRIQLHARTHVARERRAQEFLAFQPRALHPQRIPGALRNDLVMHAGVLTDIQCRQVKAEGVHAAQ